ncbi:hypothetical protein KYN89_02405 [Alteriqipengyuania sp. NZ-12B]|uniref:Uncharacterized protein n=1 Tax=Alteriqipengyuania abyssalis TaxID=2860200 RepID=A0ABS7PB08_9SPHN|nr:hypothetical protein [Alteriqipengyuania abyssalis]MBY8335892.1 hypothetical protein [Alteriqipengyuania abyssalis]
MCSAPLDNDQQAEDARYSVMIEAERKLFATKPRTVTDVRALAEIAFRDPDSIPGADLIGSVLNGLRDLDDNAPSPTFDPEQWLVLYERCGGGWVRPAGRELTLCAPVPASDGIQASLWELETRGGREQVLRLIEEREAERIAA